MRKSSEKKGIIEDATKFGEFVCSCHKWLPLDEQKERTKRLENITKKYFF